MEKQQLPPSYDDVFRSQNPTAPMMNESSPAHHVSTNAPGWNPNVNQPHYPVLTTQPLMQPQGGYQTGAPPTQTVVIINQHVQLNENPIAMICMHCGQQTISKVEYVSNWATHVMAGVLCLMGWCPCALIPYCTDCMKDAVHKCSKCNGYIGTYQRTRRRY